MDKGGQQGLGREGGREGRRQADSREGAGTGQQRLSCPVLAPRHEGGGEGGEGGAESRGQPTNEPNPPGIHEQE